VEERQESGGVSTAALGIGFVVVGLALLAGRRLPLPDWSLAALVILLGLALVLRAALTRQGSAD
jgi:hydrogenase/urease accessory protein HupE